MLARYGLVRVDVGAAPQLFAGDGHLDTTALPVDGLNGGRRQEHVSAEEPVTRIDVEVSDAPVEVVEIHVVDVADVAIRGVHPHAHDLAYPLQHGCPPPHLDTVVTTAAPCTVTTATFFASASDA